MSPSWLGSAISAGGSFLGNLFGFGSQAATNKANMELAKYQYEKNLEMWNRNNEYNNPQNQMARLKAAGLNPNLVYGQGSVGNASSTPPQFEAPTMQAYTNFGDMGASSSFDQYMRAKDLESTIKNRDANTALIKAEESLRQYDLSVTGLKTLDQIATIAGKFLSNDERRILNQYIAQEKEALIKNTTAVTAGVLMDNEIKEAYGKPTAAANLHKIVTESDKNIAETNFTKGPKTAAAYAGAARDRSIASKTSWEETEARKTFRYRVWDLRIDNKLKNEELKRCDDITATVSANLAKIKAETGYISQKSLTEAQETLIKEYEANGMARHEAEKVAIELLKIFAPKL